MSKGHERLFVGVLLVRQILISATLIKLEGSLMGEGKGLENPLFPHE
jgi:hypothetical protein